LKAAVVNILKQDEFVCREKSVQVDEVYAK